MFLYLKINFQSSMLQNSKKLLDINSSVITQHIQGNHKIHIISYHISDRAVSDMTQEWHLLVPLELSRSFKE